MTQRLILAALILAWLGLYGWSLVGVWLAEPTGDGFTRGLNRIATFLGWQFAAGIVALMLFVLRDGVPPRWRWMLWVPPGLALALVALILGVIAWSMIMNPAGSQPPGPPMQTTEGARL